MEHKSQHIDEVVRQPSRNHSFKIDTIVLIGCHGSGKSTLAEGLARRLGWVYCDEIGRRLREEILHHNPNAHAQCAQPDFDLRVTELEMARDRKASRHRIIETWHPGNLAYIEARTPQLFEPLFARIVASLGNHQHIMVQPLSISFATLRQRLNEPGPANNGFVHFLHCVGERAVVLAQRIGLWVVPAITTDHSTPEECLARILGNLHSLRPY